MPTIFIFIPILSLLIFVHEFGHFITAKLFGVKVEEFGFGIPPKIWGRKIGETEYTINFLPLGGFVRLEGEDAVKKIGFQAQSALKKAVILTAGVFCNLLVGWVILSLLFSFGNPKLDTSVIITKVAENSPAEKAGISAGSTVEKVAGEELVSTQQLVERSKQYAGEEVTFTLTTEEGRKEIKITPRKNPPEGQGPLGIVVNMEGGIVYEKVPWYLAPWRGLKQVGYILVQTLRGFFLTIRELFIKQQVPEGVAGIVGIYQLTGAAASWGFSFLMQFVALLSLNLVVFNLLPIPALDGGRLFFLTLESILGRDIDPKWKARVNQAGFAFLILLMFAVTVKDIVGIV